MATIETGGGAFLRAGGGWSRVFDSRSGRFIAEIFDGADDALAAFEAVEPDLISNGFQTLDWLTVLYEELAPSRKAMPRLVVVTERDSGDVALVLPLVVTRERTLSVASFADLGVSDYGGPILGPAQLTDKSAIRRLWREVRRAMSDIDLIRFERMPADVGGRPNPLLTRHGISPARNSGSALTVPFTVETYLAGIDNKCRKEIERCHRRWQEEKASRFFRATTAEEIAHVYLAFEEQQARRHAALHTKNILDEPGYRSFYERLAIDGSNAGLSALFALEVNGEIIATLFGIVHGGAFTRLFISTAGDEWGHLSPGRLALIEAMKYLTASGIHRFDMGIRDHPLARGFGAMPVPLFDLVVPTHGIAVPRALFHALSGRLRAKWTSWASNPTN
ncbi:GNAT family N-acetyltransferase [Hyphomicrobium sp.]|uniref:GNAT family N-acetyltransferase n=1 Tax=Hyphomicrobium sp. TaxID=82 RepID=UPI000F943038|nr:GNAT family N-acetyltransferase [Hyphomicrobium sp.]RUP08138.1 MAG: GNAT family N-acetyltransferase [Hyphomicrobium sp.]